MTTSFPTTLAAAPLPAAATAVNATNAPTDSRAGTLTSAEPGVATPLLSGASPDFAQLLGAGLTNPSAAGAVAPESSSPASMPSGASSDPHSDPTSPMLATFSEGTCGTSIRRVVLSAPSILEEASAATVVAAPAEITETTKTPLADRAALEASLALVWPMIFTVAPVVAPTASVSAPDNRPAEAGDRCADGCVSEASAAVYRVSLAVPGRAPIEVTLPVTSDPLPLSEIADALATRLSSSTSFAAVASRGLDDSTPRHTGASPAPAVATPPPAPTPRDADAVPTCESTTELPGGGEVKVELSLLPRATASFGHTPDGPVRATGSTRAENSADSSRGVLVEKNRPESAAQKNFLNSAKQALTPSRDKAGISVAEAPSTMLVSSPAPIAATSAAVPVAALVEKTPTAAEPVLTEAKVSVAHRAVEAVTQVVEAQAASRLQPVPAVQLRFKVGGEDLTVRVELRDGEVRTEFKTDSAELRSALAQEWRAVTGRSESTVRFLEPSFPATNAGGQGGGSFTSQQQSSSSHQHSQQQSRSQAEFFGSVGRSFAPAVTVAEPAPVTPLVSPTSYRLSAVA